MLTATHTRGRFGNELDARSPQEYCKMVIETNEENTMFSKPFTRKRCVVGLDSAFS